MRTEPEQARRQGAADAGAGDRRPPPPPAAAIPFDARAARAFPLGAPGGRGAAGVPTGGDRARPAPAAAAQGQARSPLSSVPSLSAPRVAAQAAAPSRRPAPLSVPGRAPAGFRLTLPPLPLPQDGRDGAVFDLTRLAGAARRRFATGIDRIDLAVARQLDDRLGERLHFALARPGGRVVFVPPFLARAFLRRLGARWSGARWSGAPGPAPWRWPLRIASAAPPPPEAAYVNAGHGGALRDPRCMAALDRNGPRPRLIYLHDLIPLEMPAAQTPAGRARFGAFLRGLSARPFAALTNSADTAARLRARAPGLGLRPAQIMVAAPILSPLPPAPIPPRAAALLDGPGPLFVALGTVEPRKNHALLLDIWERFAADPPPGPPPRLAVLGRRGWADPALLSRLRRPPPGVVWLQDASDAEAAALLAGCRALLAPSLAEGLHLPSREAAALGAPALLADLPVLREGAWPGAAILPPRDIDIWQSEIHRLCALPRPRNAPEG